MTTTRTNSNHDGSVILKIFNAFSATKSIFICTKQTHNGILKKNILFKVFRKKTISSNGTLTLYEQVKQQIIIIRQTFATSSNLICFFSAVDSRDLLNLKTGVGILSSYSCSMFSCDPMYLASYQLVRLYDSTSIQLFKT